MKAEDVSGLIVRSSKHTVDETVTLLKTMLDGKGIKLFALVDHSGEAANVGMSMLPTKLLVFGDPKAGTPLMLASHSVAIDLPLKILVWEDDEGAVQMAYNSPDYLGARHGLTDDLLKNIAGVKTLVDKVAE